MSRYDILVMIVIMNNQSYESTRWNIMGRKGAAGQANRDYISHLGDPNVDFTKLAAAHGIGGEIVYNTDQLRPAIQRGVRTLRDGRPFMLDVRIQRVGIGADLSWYQKFSLAAKRERRV